MRKILFNYQDPSSEDVQSKRDFDLVLKKVKAQQDYWKSPWFYGAIGFASISSFLIFI
ncbi:MAG: hypothetical protein QNK70_04960 [Crocinitomicaceae bacterium]|tara:strand:+ start:2392 stop:2565 length:174 start_codon:yes stop_codon:yes gene_type:complete